MLQVRANISSTKNLRQKHLNLASDARGLASATLEVPGITLEKTSEVINLVKRTWMGQTELNRVLTISEVAEILRVHPTTVYRLVKRGELPGFKIGGNWRINRASLDLWLTAGPPPHLSSRV